MREKTSRGVLYHGSWSPSLKVLPRNKTLQGLGLARVAHLEVFKVFTKEYTASQEHCSKFLLWENTRRPWNSTIGLRKILTIAHLQDTL